MISKSFRVEAGYPHRHHRSRKNRKPAAKYHGKRVMRPYLEHLKKKAEELELDK